MPRTHRRELTHRLETDLWQWKRTCQSEGKHITKTLLQARAKWLFHKHGFIDFKASDGWYWKWLARNRKASETSSGYKVLDKIAFEADKLITDLKAQQRIPHHVNLSSLDTDIGSREMEAANELIDENPASLDLLGDHMDMYLLVDKDEGFCDRLDDLSIEEGLSDWHEKAPSLSTLVENSDVMDDIENVLLTDTNDNGNVCLTLDFLPSSPQSTTSSGFSETSQLSLISGASQASLQPAGPKGESVIKRHRRQGLASMQRLKDDVVRHSEANHTYKETAIKFGIHHSTVSQWVKEQKRKNSLATPYGSNSVTTDDNPDDTFLSWLSECRQSGVRLSKDMIDKKVNELVTSSNARKPREWFTLWNARRQERCYFEGMENEISFKTTRDMQNLSYPIKFKLEVARFALCNSQYAAAKTFSVARRRIFDWTQQIENLERKLQEGCNVQSNGRSPKDKKIDFDLYEWFKDEIRAKSIRPGSKEVRDKARELYKAAGINDIKCSYGWFKRWSKRFGIAQKRVYI